jgi:phospholipid/cholesterol/gamma-HCH transport system ATP-binding protein
LDAIITDLGHEAAQEAIRCLGLSIDKHFEPLGGFSTRRHINEFVTVLPYSDRTETEILLKDFVEDLQEQGIRDLWSACLRAPAGVCAEFVILAGIAEGQPIAEIDSIINSAKHQQQEIARLRCDRGR